MGLMSSFRDFAEDTKKGGLALGSLGVPFNHSTGYDVADYFLGGIDPEFKTPHLGIAEGRPITIIGPSGSGKTTLAIQMSKWITEPFKGTGNSGVIHFDFERSSKMTRIKNLIQLSEKDIGDYYIHYDNENICTEALNDTIKFIAAQKKANPQMRVTMEDSSGKSKTFYPPTVLIIDSWATMFPRDVLASEDMMGGMGPAAIARMNNGLLKQTVGFLAAFNIIPIFINHITKKISINPRQPNRADINYLEQDESMPGGSALYFMSNTFLKVTPGAKLFPEEDYGIKGWVSKVKVIKSRNSPAGVEFSLVYDQNNGFNNELSTLHTLYENKIIGGGGRGSFLKGAEDIKFTKKTFLGTLNSSEPLRIAFNNTAIETLESVLPNISVSNTPITIQQDELDTDENA